MMKRKFLGVLMLGVLSLGFLSSLNASNTLPTSWSQKSPIFKVVSASEFKTLMEKKGIQLIDVRTPQEVGKGKIGNAKNLDFYGASFKSELNKLDKTKPVLIYCQSGNRSGQAVNMMKSMGFTEVYDLKGGWGAWPK